jgi:hypothetical protein
MIEPHCLTNDGDAAPATVSGGFRARRKRFLADRKMVSSEPGAGLEEEHGCGKVGPACGFVRGKCPPI